MTTWRSKWLDWKPEEQDFFTPTRTYTDKTDKTKPEEQSAPSFVGFVGLSVGACVPKHAAAEDFDPLDPLRQPFVRWFDDRVHLDAKALALRQPPQWSTTVAALHRDCCAWMSGHSQVVPPTLPEFRLLLREPGCSLRTIAGDEFADYVALKEDMAANAQFQRDPLPEPRETAVERALEKFPAAAPPAVLPDGTPLPVGVRLIRWNPKVPPVRLSESSTVTDTDKFIRSTLAQLDARLSGKKFLDGGWGLSGLLARLEACGVLVEIDDPGKTLQ